MMVVDQAATLNGDTLVRFAALVHDLGKAVTPEAQLPSHYGHEWSGLGCIRQMCERLRVPGDYRDLSLLACEVHLNLHRVKEMKAATLLGLLEKIDAFRRPIRLDQVLLVGEADSRGRKGRESTPYPQAQFLRLCLKAACEVDAAGIAQRSKDGRVISQAIREQRIKAIESVRRAG